MGRITKMGDQYLLQLLAVGMTSLVRQTKSHPERANKWLTALLERKPARLATVAIPACQGIRRMPEKGEQDSTDRLGRFDKERAVHAANTLKGFEEHEIARPAK